MAYIMQTSGESVFKINKFLGLNEGTDGDTSLKMGELSEIRNFKITQDGNLQIRAGSAVLLDIKAEWDALGGQLYFGVAEPEYNGYWYGSVNGGNRLVVSFGGGLWDVVIDTGVITNIGTCTADECSFFGFNGMVYLLNGHEYKVWRGDTSYGFETVTGYVPLVQTATTPAGDGTLLENVNRLNGKRRVQFSPDGTATDFYLPEKDLTSIDIVRVNGEISLTVTNITTTVTGGSVSVADVDKFLNQIDNLGGGEAGSYIFTYSTGNKWSITIHGHSYHGYSNLFSAFGIAAFGTPTNGDKITATVAESWTGDTTNGKVTFTSAPALGTNTIEIQYTKGNGAREEVERMRYSEMYNGNTDTRVFLYGDGSNRTIYSGIDGNTGLATAEYFPDLFEVSVGDANTPITSLIRHYSRLIVFKTDGTWGIHYGTTTLADSTVAAAFWCQTVNRQIGNCAMGQVKLVENSPISIDDVNVYRWSNASNYSSTLSFSDTNAKRISDKVKNSLKYNKANIKTFTLKNNCEFWMLSPNVYGTAASYAVILNYANDTWYVYEKLPFCALFEVGRNIYAIDRKGHILEFDRKYRNDENTCLDVSCNLTDWDASDIGGTDGAFVFKRRNSVWTYQNTEVDLTDYGITLSGDCSDDNDLTVTRITEGGTSSLSTKIMRSINAYAETGSIDFSRAWMLKYSPMLFVAMIPEQNARITVTVESNKKSTYPEKVVAYSFATFDSMDFNHFSFRLNRRPQVKRLKLKVKKATYYKLVMKSNSTSATATIAEVDIKVRYAGQVK